MTWHSQQHSLDAGTVFALHAVQPWSLLPVSSVLEGRGWESSFMSMKHPRNLESVDEKYFAELADYEFADGVLDKLRTAQRSIYNFDAKAKTEKLAPA